MSKLPVSLCILSWKSADTIRNTLESYRKNGLFEIVNDATILFQEVSLQDIALANEYGLNYIALNKNLGIGKAFVELAISAGSDNLITLEHDWQLIEPADVVRERLSKGVDLLLDGFHAVRYRHRKYPGYPLYSIPAYRGNELGHNDPVTGLTSPHLLDCIHWIENPEVQFPEQITKQDEFFCSTSRWSTWTNNPVMYDRYSYISWVLPFLKHDDLLLEPSISKWWAHQKFRVAYGEGLFTHNDLNKRIP